MTDWHTCPCTVCDLRGDALLDMRQGRDTDCAALGWLEWHHTTEFSRPFRTTGDDLRLLVHVEPAWAETPEAFTERQKRVRLAQERKHRGKVTDLARPPIPDTMPPRPAPPIFGARLDIA